MTHTVAEARWLILKLPTCCKEKVQPFRRRSCVGNGEQRQREKTNTENVSHPALHLEAPRSPSSDIPGGKSPRARTRELLVRRVSGPAVPGWWGRLNPRPGEAAVVALPAHEGPAQIRPRGGAGLRRGPAGL